MMSALLANRALKKLIRHLRHLYYYALSDNSALVDEAVHLQPILLTGAGTISLHRCTIGYFPSPGHWDGHCYLEAREATAEIVVADGVQMNNRATLIAERSSIRIDRDCLIGPFVQIYDSDFHAIEPGGRNSGVHICAPVHLERNVCQSRADRGAGCLFA